MVRPHTDRTEPSVQGGSQVLFWALTLKTKQSTIPRLTRSESIRIGSDLDTTVTPWPCSGVALPSSYQIHGLQGHLSHIHLPAAWLPPMFQHEIDCCGGDTPGWVSDVCQSTDKVSSWTARLFGQVLRGLIASVIRSHCIKYVWGYIKYSDMTYTCNLYTENSILLRVFSRTSASQNLSYHSTRKTQDIPNQLCHSFVNRIFDYFYCTSDFSAWACSTTCVTRTVKFVRFSVIL